MTSPLDVLLDRLKAWEEEFSEWYVRRACRDYLSRKKKSEARKKGWKRQKRLSRTGYPTLTDLRKQADALWSLYIRTLYKKCMVKGHDSVMCWGALQGGHLKDRGDFSVRYTKENGVGICAGHNKYYFWNKKKWYKLCEEIFPSQWQWVTDNAMDTKSVNRNEYNAVIAGLKRDIELLEE